VLVSHVWAPAFAAIAVRVDQEKRPVVSRGVGRCLL
jgi:hypothetical protein